MSPQFRGDVLPLLPFPLAAFAAGGDEGIRTPDPLLAKQVLCQLSYTPLLGPKVLLCRIPSKLNNVPVLSKTIDR